MFDAYILEIDRNLMRNEYEEKLQMVSPNKREQIECFHRLEDAQRTLLADVLIRGIISHKLGLPNKDIAFGLNEYGKPSLLSHPNFHFNLSHSGQYVACVVGDSAVGIDVEEIKQADLKIAERFFTENETRYILSRPDNEQSKAFYRIWTMKEAYIKREGKGLSIPLNSFNVLIESDAYFYNIFENIEAVCHVCTTLRTPPFIHEMSVKDISI